MGWMAMSIELHPRYPKNLHYKIFQRRGQCLTALGRHAEAEAALLEAIASLEFAAPKVCLLSADFQLFVYFST